jgi:hypothetical protein
MYLTIDSEVYKHSPSAVEMLMKYILNLQGKELLLEIHVGICGHHAVLRSLVGNDEDITPSDAHNTPLNIQGPITRAHVRQLNLQVSSFLSTSFYDLENRLLPNDNILIRIDEEDQGMRGRSLELDKASKGRPRHLEAQYNSTSSPPRSPRAVCLRLDAQAT